MKTITVKGFEYEVGGFYEATVQGVHISGNLVVWLDAYGEFVLSDGTEYVYLKEITRVQVKMVTGEWYKFEHAHYEGVMVGEYFKDYDMLTVHYTDYLACECSNIQLMKEV